MATAYKVLGQACPANTNEATLYTVPAGTNTIVSTLTVSNRLTAAANATVNVCVNGAASANANTLLGTVSVPANSVAAFTIGLTLSANDVVRITSGTANALVFQLFGSELS